MSILHRAQSRPSISSLCSHPPGIFRSGDGGAPFHVISPSDVSQRPQHNSGTLIGPCAKELVAVSHTWCFHDRNCAFIPSGNDALVVVGVRGAGDVGGVLLEDNLFSDIHEKVVFSEIHDVNV